MAYDPEARATSNSAMTIGIVTLVLLALAALAYFLTQRPDTEAASTAPNTVVVDRTAPAPATNTVVVPAPANPVIVEKAVPVPQTKTIIRNTKTETTKIVPAPHSGGSAGGSNTPAPNVTINNNPSASSNAPVSNAPAGKAPASAAPADGEAAPSSAPNAELPPPAQP